MFAFRGTRIPTGRSRPPQPTHRIRRIALVAAIIWAIPAAISFVSAIAAPSNSGVGIRAVEWLRDHGARGLVNKVENIYYSLNAPSTGGPGLKALPSQAGTAVAPTLHARRLHVYRPRPIAPVMSPALPGEGQWRATFAHGGTRPPVLVTSFRPDPNYPRLVAGVAWIDHTRTTTWLYPGRPNRRSTSRPAVRWIARRMRSRLVATFNSGFKMKDSGGGVAVGGHTYAPMKQGLGTIIRYRDGHVDVIAWPGGPDVGADVQYARQNLPLIVNHGRPNPNLSDGPSGASRSATRSACGAPPSGSIGAGTSSTSRHPTRRWAHSPRL